MSAFSYFLILVAVVIAFDRATKDPKAALLAVFVLLFLVTCAG